jgi:hypothetical protein
MPTVCELRESILAIRKRNSPALSTYNKAGLISLLESLQSKKAPAPAKKVEAPIKKVEAPVKKVESPVKKVEAPVKKIEAPVEPAKPKIKTYWRLVSKPQYRKNLELLRLAYNNSKKLKDTKPKVADRDLYERIKESFGRNGFNNKKIIPFMKTLVEIYNKYDKKHDLDWLVWMHDGGNDGRGYIASDEVSYGATEFYFNIYPTTKGSYSLKEASRQDYGVFMGYHTPENEPTVPGYSHEESFIG